MRAAGHGCAGGVFEEALAQATLFLEPGSPIAQTVRNADIIDNVWKSGSLSSQASNAPSPETQELDANPCLKSGCQSYTADTLTMTEYDTVR